MQNQSTPYQGDLQKTGIIDALCKVPSDQRNEEWRKLFLENIAEASLAAGEPRVIAGPDGMPYFHMKVPESGTQFQCFVLTRMLEDFVVKNGMGLALHPAKGQPDWVFTHGDLLNYYLNKEFYSEIPSITLPREESFQEKERVKVGQPHEEYLPAETRACLRTYFEQKQCRQPKILLMERTYEGTTFEELVFDITPKDFGGDKEVMDAVMRGVLWFIPRQYRIAMMEEASMPDRFENL